MNILFFLLLNLLVFCFPLTSKADSSISSQRDKATLSVWQIHGFKDFEEYIRGTGFFIGPNHFITNFHVAMSMTPSLENLEEGGIILTQQGHDIVLKVNSLLALSAFSDSALFKVEGNVKNYLSLRESSLNVREDFLIPAYPNGVFTEIKKSGNIVNGYSFPVHPVDISPGKLNSDSIPDDPYYSFPVYPINVPFTGASGSPVLDDQGQIAGILSFRSGHNSNMLNAIKPSYLREFIEGHIGTKCVLPIEEDTTYDSKLIPKAPEYQFCIKKELDNLVKLYNAGSYFAKIILIDVIRTAIGSI